MYYMDYNYPQRIINSFPPTQFFNKIPDKFHHESFVNQNVEKLFNQNLINFSKNCFL